MVRFIGQTEFKDSIIQNGLYFEFWVYSSLFWLKTFECSSLSVVHMTHISWAAQAGLPSWWASKKTEGSKGLPVEFYQRIQQNANKRQVMTEMKKTKTNKRLNTIQVSISLMDPPIFLTFPEFVSISESGWSFGHRFITSRLQRPSIW